MFIKKKTKSKGFKLKAVSFILVVALLFSLINSYSMTTEAKSNSNVYTVVDDGITYTIEQLSSSDGNSFIVTSNDNKDKAEVNISNNELEIKEYEYEGKNFFGKEIYDISEETIDISNHIENAEDMEGVSAQSISYGTKTKVEWGKHWYRYGSDGFKSYMKIGHTATYRIRTDKLSSSRETKCDNYANAIKKSNKSYTKAQAFAAGSGVLIGVAAGLVAANIVFPPSVIVTIVVASVGGGGSVIKMVDCLIDSYSYYLDCKDLYAVIKGYGTKL